MFSTDTEKLDAIHTMLENEKQINNGESWAKLDKTIKTIKLNKYADKYALDNDYSDQMKHSLKLFFVECLNKGKLQKTKDVVYDKSQGVIVSIPALCFNITNKSFTLKIIDPKRVSTLKSLAPKRSSNVAASEDLHL